MDLVLTPDEQREVLARREQRKVNDAGAYGPALKASRIEAHLRDKLTELNARHLDGGYGPLPYNLDAGTVDAIQRVQAAGFGMRTEPHGDVRPFLVPSLVALRIVEALKGTN